MTKTISERARELDAGPELDALFFETCWDTTLCENGYRVLRHDGLWNLVRPEMQCVSTDPAACEAWAMRWALERDLCVRITMSVVAVAVEMFAPYPSANEGKAIADMEGTDWKHALVRACIVAAEAMKTNQPQTGE